jgi:diadenosine tetraphosphatase ApaH/serine/threonine PP2A family protein phosphatase
MKAILSDIHANLEALEAVFEDLKRHRPKGFALLGDVIGYGPNPRECIERVMDAEIALLGNHEEALLYYPENFNPKAREALEWTREQLNSGAHDRERNYAMWDFLGNLKEQEGDGRRFRWVHGSPLDPLHEYVTPRLVRKPERLAEMFAVFPEQICFCGHSHIPGIYLEDGRFASPRSVNHEISLRALNGRRAIINVGSVGQPRDGDPRACYVTYDRERIRFHRVEYDFRPTQAKIRKVDALPDFLAARLEKGT